MYDSVIVPCSDFYSRSVATLRFRACMATIKIVYELHIYSSYSYSYFILSFSIDSSWQEHMRNEAIYTNVCEHAWHVASCSNDLYSWLCVLCYIYVL